MTMTQGNKNSLSLSVAFMNIHGQSRLPISKQLQIEDFIRYNKIDILHLQEIDISSETFSHCSLVSSSYEIIAN